MFSLEDRTASTTTDSDPYNLSQHSTPSKLLLSSPPQPVSSPHLSQSEGFGLHFRTQADKRPVSAAPRTLTCSNAHYEQTPAGLMTSLMLFTCCMLFIKLISPPMKHLSTGAYPVSLSSVKLKTSICAQHISIKITTYCASLVNIMVF